MDDFDFSSYSESDGESASATVEVTKKDVAGGSRKVFERSVLLPFKFLVVAFGYQYHGMFRISFIDAAK